MQTVALGSLAILTDISEGSLSEHVKYVFRSISIKVYYGRKWKSLHY
jgi:hypothetical protein